jgi:hypothetical protein
LRRRLVRDLESPADDQIGPNDPATFSDGPVFYTRQTHATLRITVNQRVFTEADGVKRQMTGVEVATLVFPESPRETVVHWRSAGDREVGLDETIHIEGCDVFYVTRRKVEGGYELSRVEREVDQLRASGGYSETANLTSLFACAGAAKDAVEAAHPPAPQPLSPDIGDLRRLIPPLRGDWEPLLPSEPMRSRIVLFESQDADMQRWSANALRRAWLGAGCIVSAYAGGRVRVSVAPQQPLT